jgi:hypothetical protein
VYFDGVVDVGCLEYGWERQRCVHTCMYKHVCIRDMYIHVCIRDMYIHVHVCIRDMYIHVFAYMCVLEMHTYMCVLEICTHAVRIRDMHIHTVE